MVFANLALEYYRSVFVTLMLLSGVMNPFPKIKKYTFLRLKCITKTALKL